MRFRISIVDNTPEETIGKVTNVDTAQNLLIFQSEEIDTIKIPGGKYRFNTGFSAEPINRNNYIPQDEKVVLLKAQKEAAKRVAKEVFGNEKKEIDDTDFEFWKQPQYSKLDITNEISTLIYDTERIEHLILYWQIVCDAFWSVAYNLEHAMFKGCPYFLQEIKDAENRDALDEMTKLGAMGILNDLVKEGNQEALLYLTWAIGDKNDKLGGNHKSTGVSTLAKSLLNFIEGKTKERGKKNAVVEFTKAYAEYKADRDFFMMKVIVKIADYHSLIYPNKDNVYMTKDGVMLGKTIDECVDILKKVSNRDIFEELTTDVMKILTNDF